MYLSAMRTIVIFTAGLVLLSVSALTQAGGLTEEHDIIEIANRHAEERLSRLPDWQRRVEQPLLRAWNLYQEGTRDTALLVQSPRHLLPDHRLLVEIRYDLSQRTRLLAELEVLNVEVLHDVERGGWLEAAASIEVIEELTRIPEVGSVGLTRLPEHHGGGTTSEAVELGQADLWHAAGLRGDGVNIAVVDAFNDTDGQIAHLQSLGDWPPDEQITRIDMNPCSGFGGCEAAPPHGNAVVEVIYDLAPEANFILYDAAGLASNIQAITHAVDFGNADIINLSVNNPGDTPGDGSSPPGSMAEAIEYARSQGALVVISAGNSRGSHWGGEFNSPQGSGPGSLHHWDEHGTEWANHRLVSGSRCIPDGTVLTGELYWNDWGSPTNDYELWLWRFEDATTPFGISDNDQTGESWQRPAEFIHAVAQSTTGHPACKSGEAKYAWSIRNADATGDHNFRFWSTALEERRFSSTLATPADSPHAITVGAIFAGSQNYAGYSGEGPILAPGGAAPTGQEYPKPDIVSFASVSNTTLGTFHGTSVSAPHVTGMAALLWQRHSGLFDQFGADQIADRIRLIGQQGSNDFGPSGHDFQTGWGRLRFQAETDIEFLTQPSDSLVSSWISPNPAIEILDDEGVRVVSGPTAFMDIAIGNDPSEGQATLMTPLNFPVIDGYAEFASLEIDWPGLDYTLLASSETHVRESLPFNILPRVNVVAGSDQGFPGSEVRVPVSVSDNLVGAVAMQVDILFDQDRLELSDGGEACGYVDSGNAVDIHEIQCQVQDNGALRVNVEVPDGTTPQPLPEGELVRARFSIDGGAAPGSQALVFPGNIILSDANAAPISASMVTAGAGQVTVLTPPVESMQVMLGTETGSPGSDVSLPLLLEMNSENAVVLDATIGFDPDLLELRSGGSACIHADEGSAIFDESIGCQEVEPGLLQISIASPLQFPVPDLPEGELARLRFAVSELATSGSAIDVWFVDLEMMDNNGAMINQGSYQWQDGSIVVAGAGLAVNPDEIDLGSVHPQDLPVQRSIEVANSGDPGSQLEIVELALTGSSDFSIHSENCMGTTMEFGDTCQIVVELAQGSASGPHEGVLVVESNASDNPVSMIQLDATVISLEDVLFIDRFESPM